MIYISELHWLTLCLIIKRHSTFGRTNRRTNVTLNYPSQTIIIFSMKPQRLACTWTSDDLWRLIFLTYISELHWLTFCLIIKWHSTLIIKSCAVYISLLYLSISLWNNQIQTKNYFVSNQTNFHKEIRKVIQWECWNTSDNFRNYNICYRK